MSEVVPRKATPLTLSMKHDTLEKCADVVPVVVSEVVGVDVLVVVSDEVALEVSVDVLEVVTVEVPVVD